MAEVLELFVPEMLVDVIDVLVLLVEVLDIEVLLLQVLVAELLEKLALVKDALEVLVPVLVADMLEVEHAVVLVVALVRLQVLVLEILVDVLIDVVVLLVKVLVTEVPEVLVLVKDKSQSYRFVPCGLGGSSQCGWGVRVCCARGGVLMQCCTVSRPKSHKDRCHCATRSGFNSNQRWKR